MTRQRGNAAVAAYSTIDCESNAQHRWRRAKCFTADATTSKAQFLCQALPSNLADRLHLGHCRNHIICDVMARYQRMQGRNVLHAAAWDTFGLQTHLAAKVAGVDPATWSKRNVKEAQQLLTRLGVGIDWTHTVSTCEPDHFRHMQELFLRLWHAGDLIDPQRRDGVAYWDPGTQTYLSLRHLVNGRGPESGMLVEVHEVKNYELKVSAKLADGLLTGLEKLPGWDRSTRNMQRESIGREKGLTITFPLHDHSGNAWSPLPVFTSRPDTLMGTTFIAVGTDHEIARQVALGNDAVAAFCAAVNEPTYAYRKMAEDKRQEGMPLGIYALSPVNGDHVPVWVANFVVAGYGTNAVLGVPGHDQRNFNFAQRHNLPLRRIEAYQEDDLAKPLRKPLTDKQALPCNSGALEEPLRECKTKLLAELAANSDSTVATSQAWREYWDDTVNACVLDFLAEHGVAATEETVTRLRNWKISTQDYWGSPVPLVHCAKCGTVPVKEKDLPLTLPKYELGKDALADYPDFIACECPACGKAAQRDTDTLTSLIDTAWLHARLTSPAANNIIENTAANKWLPVDFYCCGVENATNHLLSMRLMHRLLGATNLLPTKTSAEPVRQLLSQGMVLNYGLPMAKPYANMIEPGRLLDEFGADVLRLFLSASVDPRHALHWDDHKLFALQGILNAKEFTALCAGKLTGARLEQATAVLTAGERKRLQHGLLEHSELHRLRHRTLKGAKHKQAEQLLNAGELTRLQSGLLTAAELRALRTGKLNPELLAQVRANFSDIEIERLRHGLLAPQELEQLCAGQLAPKLQAKVAAAIPAAALKQIKQMAPNPRRLNAIAKLQETVLDALERKELTRRAAERDLLLQARSVLTEHELTNLRLGLLDHKQYQALRAGKLRGTKLAEVKKLLTEQEYHQISTGVLERDEMVLYRRGKLATRRLAAVGKVLGKGVNLHQWQTYGVAASKIALAKATLPDLRRLEQLREGTLSGAKLAAVRRQLSPKGYAKYLASLMDHATYVKVAGFIAPARHALLVNYLEPQRQQALNAVLDANAQKKLRGLGSAAAPRRPLLRFLDRKRMNLLLSELDDSRMDELAAFISHEKMEQLLGFTGLVWHVLTHKLPMVSAGQGGVCPDERRIVLHENLAAVANLYGGSDDAASDDSSGLHLNRVVTRARELLRLIEAAVDQDNPADCALVTEGCSTLLRILHPLIPHVTEELWQQLGFAGLLAQASWPKADKRILARRAHLKVVVQVNGRHQLSFTAAAVTPRRQLNRHARTELTTAANERGFPIFPAIGEQVKNVEWAQRQGECVINFVVTLAT